MTSQIAPQLFTPAEYDARREAVQQRMAERGWAALVVVDPANLYYLTGYNAWSFYVPQCLILPADGQPHLFLRAMDAGGAHYTAELPPDRIHGYPEHLVHRPDQHPYGWITERARELGLLADRRDAPIAIEMDAHYLSPRAFLTMRQSLETTTFVDCQETVNWVRLVKSPAEQDYLRAAGRITDRVMTVALDGVRAGRRQYEVVADIQHAQATGAEHGGDYPAMVPMLPTGPRAGTPHLTWTDARLQQGQATTIELAGVSARYHAPLARTVSLGAASARLASCADAVSEGMSAVLETMKPGVRGADVHAAFNAVIVRHGLAKESRIGYSIGIGYPPDWGERTVSLRSEEHTVLLSGMAFHVILGMWMGDWGYETSESVLLTDSGTELLTTVPRDLVVRP